ncbi:hypothetical protein RRG08_033733 [Elysia crispata]|uniref:Uncharacterized protein n=1 Tax=Elysia crispata TaxID=231223 RepID=A0AAE1AAK2_9GAST|nr:hypothetical protein RRG08_033733 [Elysia crispata]
MIPSFISIPTGGSGDAGTARSVALPNTRAKGEKKKGRRTEKKIDVGLMSSAPCGRHSVALLTSDKSCAWHREPSSGYDLRGCHGRRLLDTRLSGRYPEDIKLINEGQS